jgi:hypothetical protein
MTQKSITQEQDQKIDSWTDLAKLIEHCATGNWIFRGESRADNILQAKAGRVSAEVGAARKVPYRIDDERKALEQFKLQARPYLGYSPESEIEWLAIAQHHGMSTRLLDWTESLLVAAFFATMNAGISSGKRCDAVIYGVKGLQQISKQDEDQPFELEEPGIYRPPHITPRIPAQRSVFTLHPDPTLPFVHRYSKWVVSSKACGNIKKILDSCAINESSLFPDIDGLSRYLGWRYKWGKFPN